MELKVGLKFSTFFNKNNINNRPLSIVKAIVDDIMIVLYTQTRDGNWYYHLITVDQFKFYVGLGHYIPVK